MPSQSLFSIDLEFRDRPKSLRDNFDYFNAYFGGKFADSMREVRIDGTVEDMSFLLSIIQDPSFSKPDDVEMVAVLVLADKLLLKKEKMDCLIGAHKESVKAELYSKKSYEKFLSGELTFNEFLLAYPNGIENSASIHFTSLTRGFAAISDNGHYGLTTSGEVLDLTSSVEKVLFKVPFRDLSRNEMKFSPDGKMLWVGAKIWNVESGTELFSATREACRVIFSPDSKWILWINQGGEGLVLNTSSIEHFITPFSFGVGEVIFSPDSRFFAFVMKRELRVLDLITNTTMVFKKRFNDSATSILFSPDSKKVACVENASPGYGGVEVYDLQTGDSIFSDDQLSYAFVTVDNTLLVRKNREGDSESYSVLYDMSNRKEISPHFTDYPVGMSPNGTNFLLSSSSCNFFKKDTKFSLFNPVTKDDVVALGKGIRFAFSNNSELVSIQSQDNEIVVFDMMGQVYSKVLLSLDLMRSKHLINLRFRAYPKIN